MTKVTVAGIALCLSSRIYAVAKPRCQIRDSAFPTMPPTPAEDEDAQFGFANIPFGVVSTDDDQIPQIATRLFGHVFKLPTLIRKGLLGSLEEETRSALLKVCPFYQLPDVS